MSRRVRSLPFFALSAVLSACGADWWPWGEKDEAPGGYGQFEEEAKGNDQPSTGGFTHHVPRAVEAQGLPPAITAFKNGELTDSGGNVISLRGCSWFGFAVADAGADSGGTLHGLWQNDPMASDFATVLLRQKLLGFNAVRLPFSFSLFPHKPKPWPFDCTVPSDVEVATATTDPAAGKAPTVMSLPKPPTRAPGKCNDYLPLTTVRDQLMFVVKAYVDNGFYVLLDNHLREDNTAIDNHQAWLDGWKAVATDLEAYEPARGRVMFDLLNEPGQKGVSWDKLGDVYLSAMDTIWGVSKSFPFLIEGTGQEGLGANWGDGYCTDPAKIQQGGLSDPTSFFTALAGKPYASWVILGPHVYGPAVTTAPDRFSGTALFDRLDASFGLAHSDGLNLGGRKIQFPVAIGEFGSKFEDGRDKVFMADFAAYLNHKDSAAARPGKPIVNWFYWDWNADSGDTGGLVKDDWKTIEWDKIRYLRGLGLGESSTPTSASSTLPTKSPAATTEAAPSASPAPEPSATPPAPPATPPAPPTSPASPPPAAPSSPAPEASDAPKATLLPAQGPQLASAPIVFATAQPPPPEVSAMANASTSAAQEKSGPYHGSISLWESGGSHFASVNLFFSSDLMAKTETPFKVTVDNPDYQELVQAWNMDDAKIDDTTIFGTVSAPWAQMVPGSHNVVNVGFIVRGKTANLDPAHVSINGKELPPPA